MKKLILINGTMGVGKTTTSQYLKEELFNCVFLDGDWCWDASPFIVNEETKKMVLNNITTLLNNFLASSVYEHIVFCWVMDEQEIIDAIVSKLEGEYVLFTISLLCNSASLIERLSKDIANGKRSKDIIQRSIERNQKYQEMQSMHIDVSNISPKEAATKIALLLQ